MNKYLPYILSFSISALIVITSIIVSGIYNFNEETIKIDKESGTCWPYWEYMK